MVRRCGTIAERAEGLARRLDGLRQQAFQGQLTPPQTLLQAPGAEAAPVDGRDDGVDRPLRAAGTDELHRAELTILNNIYCQVLTTEETLAALKP